MEIGAWYVRRRWSRLLVGALALTLGLAAVLIQPQSVLAEEPPSQPFDLIYEVVGEKVGAVQNGAGMFGRTEGNVTIDVSGVSVRKAYLIWSGLGRDEDGILFGMADGSPPQRVTAGWTWNNDTFGADTWGCCGGELTAYAADITDLGIIQMGEKTYTVSDMSVEHGSEEENWGYSLVVVYEDPTLETVNDVIVKLGNDGLHFRWDGMLGPNSDVQCVTVPGAAQDRVMSFIVVVGGIADIYRPNGLWGRTGNEDFVTFDEDRGTWNQSLGLIDGVSGITGIGGSVEIDGPLDGDWTDNGVDWPFTDNRGNQWDLYPVIEIALDTGDTWACVQLESANRPEIPAGPDTFQLGASIGFMGLLAIFESHEQPDIDIEKFTNGEDADEPTGPVVIAGDTVTWTFEVTNIGEVTLFDVAVNDDLEGDIDCPKEALAPDESMTCVETGTAISGQYANVATVVGKNVSGTSVTDKDPSHYLGQEPDVDAPDIDIEKYTNGEDADEVEDAVLIDAGNPVTWTYVVTNIGNVTLSDVAVTDSKDVEVVCPKDVLTPNETMTCVGTGNAGQGPYENIGTVVGKAPDGEAVTDLDPSHYTNVPTGIDAPEPNAPRQWLDIYLPLLTLR